MNTAIIVAAGSGKRFGSEIPKQFLEILGKPILIHTIERFESCDSIDEVVLVLSPSEIDGFVDKFPPNQFKKLAKVTKGGKTRAESVYNGLKMVNPATEIVAVHDGARPLVSARDITKTINMALETGAACLACEVTDTIKFVKDGKIVRTVDRAALRKALTPQCFKREVLIEAFEKADFSDAATDECYLVEKLGQEIAIVEGSSSNIKVTTREDLLIAETFLKLERD